MSIRIDRCVCHNRTFAELRDLATSTGAKSLPVLQQCADECGLSFGESCGLCHPYVHAMFIDGRVVFHEILTAHHEDAR